MAYFFVLLSVMFAAAGQIFLKMGTIGVYGLYGLVNPKTFIGLFFYMAGACLWILSLSKLPLKVVYPFTALTFVLVYIGSAVLFNEPISRVDLLGVFFVLFGLFCLAAGNF